MAIAVFEYAAWAARYPQIAASVDEALATLYFNEATLYLSNDDCSLVQDVARRLTLLNMITAHIAMLNAVIGGVVPSGLVGQILKATEGTVSVDVAPVGSGNSALAAWFSQTAPGFQFWAVTANLRTMHYRPGPRPSFEPFPYYGGGYGWRR